LSASPSGNGTPLLLAPVLAFHAALIAAAALLALELFPSSPAREIAALLAVTPLLVALWGLLTRRRAAAPWLALLLVVYCGAASVEVVANAGAARAASAALLAAIAELGCLLVIIRRSRPHPPTGAG
jgi:uncharacterized membrane protein